MDPGVAPVPAEQAGADRRRHRLVLLHRVLRLCGVFLAVSRGVQEPHLPGRPAADPPLRRRRRQLEPEALRLRLQAGDRPHHVYPPVRGGPQRQVPHLLHRPGRAVQDVEPLLVGRPPVRHGRRRPRLPFRHGPAGAGPVLPGPLRRPGLALGGPGGRLSHAVLRLRLRDRGRVLRRSRGQRADAGNRADDGLSQPAAVDGPGRGGAAPVAAHRRLLRHHHHPLHHLLGRPRAGRSGA